MAATEWYMLLQEPKGVFVLALSSSRPTSMLHISVARGTQRAGHCVRVCLVCWPGTAPVCPPKPQDALQVPRNRDVVPVVFLDRHLMGVNQPRAQNFGVVHPTTIPMHIECKKN